MSFNSPFPSNLGNLFKEHDCIVRIGENKLNVHKKVLMKCSPVFDAMLKSNMAEANSNEIAIDDCDSEVFEALLLLFYGNSLKNEVMDRLGDKIFVVANKYQVKEVNQACIDYFSTTITVENAVQRLIIAEVAGSSQLLEETILFIIERGEDIFKFSSITSLVSPSTTQLFLSEYASRYTHAKRANALLRQSKGVKNDVLKSPSKQSSPGWQAK